MRKHGRVGGPKSAEIDAPTGRLILEGQPAVCPSRQPERFFGTQVLPLAITRESAECAAQKSICSRRRHIDDPSGPGLADHHRAVATVGKVQVPALQSSVVW